MKLNSHQRIFLVFYLFLVALWLVLFVAGQKEGFENYAFSFLFGLVPLLGGFIAMRRAHIWGGFQSAVGKAVFFIGLGIFLWGAGETVWSYYNFFAGVAAPYPSLADIGFAPSIFFYGLGAVYLSRATGAKFGLRNPLAKLFITIAPFIILVAAYYILVVVARGGVVVPDGETPLKTVLDIAYPLGGFINLAICIIVSGLSFKYIGGKYKTDIYAILAGLLVMFVADSVFSYTTTIGTYYNANFGDLLLATGTFLLSFGVLGFYEPKTADQA